LWVVVVVVVSDEGVVAGGGVILTVVDGRLGGDRLGFLLVLLVVRVGKLYLCGGRVR
jgi:hypothetical protein